MLFSLSPSISLLNEWSFKGPLFACFVLFSRQYFDGKTHKKVSMHFSASALVFLFSLAKDGAVHAVSMLKDMNQKENVLQFLENEL